MRISKFFFISSAFLALSAMQTPGAQEALDSVEERYYDFLSLTGNTSRSFLVYRTLSDSIWNSDSAAETEWRDVWSKNNLGKTRTLWQRQGQERNFFTRGFDNSIEYKVYGPEWLSSYNTKSPYGVNDGALWQGRGYNTALTGGARIQGFGFELTFKPQLSYSQNKDYAYLTSSSMKSSSLYSGKASDYGYTWTVVDYVQRYGDGAVRTFDWGDTEIRWSWHTFTVGFGTQPVWLGPAFYSPLLSSNNAASYPKFDFGLRKTRVTIPFIDWYLGDIETRLWVGKLTESDYFDNDDSNDHNQYSGFTFAYSPSFMKGLTLGVCKITVSKWGDDFWTYAYPGFYGNTRTGSKSGRKGEDQKASLYADWLLPKAGFEVYGELGFDDFLSDGIKLYEYERYPLHALAWNWGLKKSFDISRKHSLRGILQFEWNWSEPSQDYQLWYGSSYNFGTHGQITQGYTNRGQWIGSGYGYGGNSQLLSFTLYSRHGYEKLFIQRNNPDNGYIYSKAVGADANATKILGNTDFTAFKANFNIGFEEMWYILPSLSLRAGIVYNKVINPEYNPGETETGYYREYTFTRNINMSLAVKYQL